jgi:hypothetical protein
MTRQVNTTDNPEKPAGAVPADEPFGVWWPKYLERVNESTSEAERHLQIPPGTISSIPGDPDFIATVKTYAVIEPLLNELIVTWPAANPVLGLSVSLEPNENFRSFVTGLTISGNSGKLKLAEGLGLLTESQIPFIRAVARVRNRYAHNVKNMHLSLTEILTEEQQANKQIVAQLTGLQSTLPAAFEDGNLVLKLLMFHRLADFLANVLHTIRPPPPRPGGLLGALLATGTPTASQRPDASDDLGS